jgi:hypothetical protein
MPFDPPLGAYQVGTSGDDSAYDFVAEALRLRGKWQGAATFGREADKKKIRVLIETRRYLWQARAHRGLFAALARGRGIKYGKLATKVLRFIIGMRTDRSRTPINRFGDILAWLADQQEPDAELWERVRPLRLGDLERLTAGRKTKDDGWFGYWGVGENETEWMTPKRWIEILGPFDLDPCSPSHDHWTAAKHYTRADNGLAQPWHGRVFVNSPYGRNGMGGWADRFIEHGDGVMLTADSTSTVWFQRLIAASDMLLFVNRKIKFIGLDGQAAGHSFPRGTALFAMGEESVKGLFRARQAEMGELVR